MATWRSSTHDQHRQGASRTAAAVQGRAETERNKTRGKASGEGSSVMGLSWNSGRKPELEAAEQREHEKQQVAELTPQQLPVQKVERNNAAHVVPGVH